MKKIAVVLLGCSGMLMSCENPIRMETNVKEDGSLDKTIVLEKTDKFRETSNMFGISKESGWEVKLDSTKKNTRIEVPDTIDSRGSKPSEAKEDKYHLTFKKSFSSVAEANAELDKNIDSLFRVHAKFEKRFRWFYTYIRYSETFRPIDRLKGINSKDYFNLEDSLFISRLPGEGKAISKADSLFLKQLNEKIFEQYSDDALKGEVFQILTEITRKHTQDKKWLDTLRRKKAMINDMLDKEDGEASQALLHVLEKLKIPISTPEATEDAQSMSKEFTGRINFMSFARDGKYTNIIDMPWAVVNSNADSVAGNKLYWRPLATKFAIQEYTMFAESRQLNLWAGIVSVLLVGLSAFVVLRSRARS